MAILSVGSTEDSVNGGDITWTEIIANTSYYTDVSVTVPSLASNRCVIFVWENHGIDTNQTGITSIVWDQGVANQTMNLTTDITVGSQYMCVGYLSTADSPTQNATITVRVTMGFSGAPSARTVHCVSAWATADGALTYDTSSTGNGTTSGSNPYYYTVTTTVGGAGVLFSGTVSVANAVSDPFPDGTELQEADSGGNCSIVGYSTPSGAGSVNHRHGYSQDAQATMGTGVSFTEGGGGGGGVVRPSSLTMLGVT